MQTFSLRFLLKFSPVFLLSSALFGQFKASTELVVVDALIESKKTGLPVRSLQRGDFEIYEDKVRQDITQFSLDTVPLSIVFLFDMTESVRPVLKPLAEGALGALQHLKPEDEVAVMLYAAQGDLTQDFTTDRSLIARAIASASECNRKPDLCQQEAYFNEGIFQAATRAHASSNASNRPVIIWLTDNVPNIPNKSVHSETAALELLHQSGVVVCTLMEKSAMSRAMEIGYTKSPIFLPFRMANPPGDVHKYAAETGGVVIGANRNEISEKLAGLIDRIRSRYTIGYRPAAQKPDGTLCKIEVKLTREASKRLGDVDIRARRAYQR